MIKEDTNMIEILITVLIAIFAVAIILEAVKNKLNPVPLMNNDDKRFIFINNVKTRKMYEGNKR